MSLGACLLALLAKEVAITLPAVLVLWDWRVRGTSATGGRRGAGWLATLRMEGCSRSTWASGCSRFGASAIRPLAPGARRSRDS